MSNEQAVSISDRFFDAICLRTGCTLDQARLVFTDLSDILQANEEGDFNQGYLNGVMQGEQVGLCQGYRSGVCIGHNLNIVEVIREYIASTIKLFKLTPAQSPGVARRAESFLRNIQGGGSGETGPLPTCMTWVTSDMLQHYFTHDLAELIQQLTEMSKGSQ